MINAIKKLLDEEFIEIVNYLYIDELNESKNNKFKIWDIIEKHDFKLVCIDVEDTKNIEYYIFDLFIKIEFYEIKRHLTSYYIK